MKLNQKGVSHLLILISLVVILVIAMIGYRVSNGFDTETADDAVLQSTSGIPDEINSKVDVRKADKALDDTKVESGVNPGQLDDDVEELL